MPMKLRRRPVTAWQGIGAVLGADVGKRLTPEVVWIRYMLTQSF